MYAGPRAFLRMNLWVRIFRVLGLQSQETAKYQNICTKCLRFHLHRVFQFRGQHRCFNTERIQRTKVAKKDLVAVYKVLGRKTIIFKVTGEKYAGNNKINELVKDRQNLITNMATV